MKEVRNPQPLVKLRSGMSKFIFNISFSIDKNSWLLDLFKIAYFLQVLIFSLWFIPSMQGFASVNELRPDN